MELISKIENVPHGGVFVFLWSFILGVLVSSLTAVSPLLALLVMFITTGLIFIDKKLILLCLSLFAFSLGVLRFDIKDFHLKDLNIERSVGVINSLEGVVVSEPEQRENDKRFILKTDSEKILVSSPFVQHVEYGDQVLVIGKLERPGVIQSEVGRPFDYAKFLSKDDIYYTTSFAKVSVVAKNKGNYIRSSLFKIKHLFTNKMNELFAEPESSLLAGLLVSGKQALPKSILEEFKRAGVVHIVVLSGYNITIVAEFLRKIFSFLSFSLSIYASVFGILLFTLMTGATSTVVRAAIMVLIVILGKALHRTYSVPRALLLVAFLMLLENPKILVYDPSFQLSFLAVLALVFISPIIENKLGFITEWGGLRSIISTTIATQVTVLPYLLYSMGSVSVVSLVSNLLILIFVPFTMLVGFISTMLGFLNYYLALPFTYISHILLLYILSIAHYLGNLKYATLEINYFPLWLTILIYLGLGIFIWRLKNSPQHSANLNS